MPRARIHGSGEVVWSFVMWISTWTCGPVEWPVLPESATTCPEATIWPWATLSTLLWQYQEIVPSQYWISTLLP